MVLGGATHPPQGQRCGLHRDLAVRILLADDLPVARKGLKQILAGRYGQAAAFGEAGTERELLELVRQRPWDILLLNANLCGGSALDAIKQIKKLRPRLPVLVLSLHPEDHL